MIEFKEIVKRYFFLHKRLFKKILSLLLLATIAFFIVFFVTNDRHYDAVKKQYRLQKIKILKLLNLSYDKVSVVGLVHASEDKIREIIKIKTKNVGFEHLGSKVIDEIRSEIEKINWVKEVFINRNVSFSLDIKITEYSPFAIWEHNNKRYVIDKNGTKIDTKNIDDFNYLIIVNGDKANLKVKSLFNIFSAKPEIGRYVYSASLIGDRRWDIRFRNNILVKLPEKNIDKAWKRLEKIYNDQELIDVITAIDLRIEDKMFLKISNE
jgi:cell division protein FtsQ